VELIFTDWIFADQLKAEYVKITSNSKSAAQSAGNAMEMVKQVEAKHSALKVNFGG